MIAHRGLALGGLLENSVDAFAAALDAGAHYLETDAHATADGVAVLLHDPDLRRLAGRDVAVSALTLAELRAIEPFGNRICTLVDALQTFPSARFNIDVKAKAAIAPVAAAIRDAAAADRVLVTSFSSARRTATLARTGDVATSASAPQVLGAVLGGILGLRALTRAVLRHVDAVQIPEKAGRVRLTTPRMLRAFADAGVEVHIWTVNEPSDMRRLLDAGVDGIVTDRCDLLAAEVRRRSE
ncbi:glycerophosphodiester phosphodiesterase family protein [Naasia aerilata]|uniref:glycerophosphodiester phosphodiesterase family protein n=1 Tax=Naasia aerilata TaxID=1162966 RepID=UPI0025747060|nr:glycerophosphodiester phosphodiesterase family protein [Naasia aerilata]